MEEQFNKQNKFGKWVKTSITARMFMVGFLIIVLLIPLAFIQNLISERANRQKHVVNEINQSWGGEVLLYGPILKIPYKTYNEKIYTSDNGESHTEKIEQINYAYIFPESLDIKSTINPNEKQRGIYKTAVYQSKIELNGKYNPIDFSEVDVDTKDILWDKAKVILQISNLKGVNEKIIMKIKDTSYEFSSKYNGVNHNSLNEYHSVNLHKLETKTLDMSQQLGKGASLIFNINLNINGSEQIRFVPVGKETKANIVSNWKTATFFGQFLPYNEDKIHKNGFDAKWKILDINRPFAQQYFNELPILTEFAFGVKFRISVYEYLKCERSTKYGFMVIALTFLVFFLIQTLSNVYIHPFQYLMIGVALTMFYTLLISISEHSTFLNAYLIATLSVMGLISIYSKTILKGIKFPLFIALSLTALYLFIYIIIQLESYALLVGSIGLFVILAIVMFVSRKVDWKNE